MRTKFPAGTTKEQWDAYEIEKAEHEAYCDRIEPKEKDFTDEFGCLDERAYNMAMREWDRVRLMDAPNEPGYYRANND